MTGLIYVAIIAVWAVVLVPAWLRRHDHMDSERSVDRFSRSLQALSKRDSVFGIPLPVPESSDAGTRGRESRASDVAPEVFTVSRPGPRWCQQPGVRASRPGRRRRQGRDRPRPSSVCPGILGVGLAVVAGLVVGGILLPIALVVPVSLIVAFVAAARHQVRTAQQRREVKPRSVPTTRAASAPAQRGVRGGPGGDHLGGPPGHLAHLRHGTSCR